MDTPIGAEVGSGVLDGLGVEVGRAVAVLVARGVEDGAGVSVALVTRPPPTEASINNAH